MKVVKLIRYGFERAGSWKHNESYKHKVNFELSVLEEDRVIYAFVVNDEVKYIGICDDSKTTLTKRMERYRSAGKSRRTGWRVIHLIKERLDKKEVVVIYALKPEPLHEYQDLQVDLVKGLENPLIGVFDPEWNERAKRESRL